MKHNIIRKFRYFLHELVDHYLPRFMRSKIASCEEVINILNSNHNEISSTKKFKLKIHLLICQCCVDYIDQIKTIEKSVRKISLLNLTEEQDQVLRKNTNDLVSKFSIKK